MSHLRYWREAASLILAGRSATMTNIKTGDRGDTKPDYKVLMLKRSERSSFMPNVYVYPGGTVSDVDFAPDWEPLFSRFALRNIDDIVKDFVVSGARPPMLASPIVAGDPKLHRNLAFRVCAIRETFEESGVLLVTRDVGDRNRLTNVDYRYFHNARKGQLDVWRRKVQKDPWKFLDMCKDLEVVPDVWALTEWCNWLTPAGLTKVKGPSVKPRRFDTVFYVCCLDYIPDAKQDFQETTNAKWLSPADILIGPTEGGKEIPIIGPQVYETARLANFSGLDDLFRYIRKRETLGLDQWFTVYFICNDGIVGVLPGDDMYPEHPDREGTQSIQTIDKTVDELRSLSENLNRYERWTSDSDKRQYHCNIRLAYGQVTPNLSGKHYSPVNISKLIGLSKL